MIVYSGKQRGNDFNNGDEALFEDAGLPRDSNMFKILPGINTRKNDYRTANSGIAAQGTFFGLDAKAGQANIRDNDEWLFNPATLSTEGSTILGRPYVNVKDGDVVVGKSGVYAITCQALFIAPASYSSKISSTTFSTSAAFYKFYVAFLLNGEPSMYTQSRGCGALDAHSVFYVGWLDTGDRVNVGYAHTSQSDTFNISSSINLYRLS